MVISNRQKFKLIGLVITFGGLLLLTVSFFLYRENTVLRFIIIIITPVFFFICYLYLALYIEIFRKAAEGQENIEKGRTKMARLWALEGSGEDGDGYLKKH